MRSLQGCSEILEVGSFEYHLGKGQHPEYTYQDVYMHLFLRPLLKPHPFWEGLSDPQT